MENLKPSNKKVKYKKWSKEETINGITKSIKVEQVSNGYIITYCKYGRDMSVEDSEYIDEEVKKISTTNPFEKKEDDFGDLMKSATNSIDWYL